MTDQIHYRVGRHQAQNVYRHGPGDPPDGSYIGVFFNFTDAWKAVSALNAAETGWHREKLSEVIEANQDLAAKLEACKELFKPRWTKGTTPVLNSKDSQPEPVGNKENVNG